MTPEREADIRRQVDATEKEWARQDMQHAPTKFEEGKMKITVRELRKIIQEALAETKSDSIDPEKLHLEEEEMDEYGRPIDSVDEEHTPKYDDHPALKGKQKTKLPDALQKGIISKAKKLDEAAKKYSHINFKPTKSIAAAAERGLEYRRKAGGKGGLSGKQAKKQGVGSGVQRAVNLKNRDSMSPATVKRMKSFFDRHQKNKEIGKGKKPYEDRGYVAWLLWGGDPGYSWARKIVRQMDAADEKSKK